MVRLGKNLRQLRVARGLSQKQLAAALGYSNANTLSNIENGRAGLYLHQVIQLCEVLGCQIEDIIQEKDTAEKRPSN